MRTVSAPGLRHEAFVELEAISAWCMMYAALTSSLSYVLVRLASDTDNYSDLMIMTTCHMRLTI